MWTPQVTNLQRNMSAALSQRQVEPGCSGSASTRTHLILTFPAAIKNSLREGAELWLRNSRSRGFQRIFWYTPQPPTVQTRFTYR